jgi:archaellum biogenesis protein FlaJ (TadC family)
MKALRLVLTFYKSFAFASLMITLSCMIISYTHGMSTFTALFWFKIITLGLIIYFINGYKRDEFYYYKNLGISKLFLWISTLSFDIVLFIVLFLITLKFR